MMSEEVNEHVLPGVGSLVVTDPRLLLAARQSHESRAMLPVIKEELRLRIMTQRHAQGKEEIVVDFNNNNVKYELTEAEREKKLRRREQNRRAAQRCRQKKKRMQNGTIENYDMICQKHDELTSEISSLTKEVQQLQALYDEHVFCGKCRLLKSDTASNDSLCVNTSAGVASPASPYTAECVTTPYGVSTSSYDVTNYTPVADALNDNLGTNDLDCTQPGDGHAWATLNVYHQVPSVSSTSWSDQQDISDLVTEVFDLEQKELAEDPLCDPLNQSLYESALPTCEYPYGNQQHDGSPSGKQEYPCGKQQLEEYPCCKQQLEEYPCGKQQKQNQMETVHCNQTETVHYQLSPGVLDHQDVMMSSEDSTIYLFPGDQYAGSDCARGVAHGRGFISCQHNHVDHISAEP